MHLSWVWKMLLSRKEKLQKKVLSPCLITKESGIEKVTKLFQLLQHFRVLGYDRIICSMIRNQRKKICGVDISKKNLRSVERFFHAAFSSSHKKYARFSFFCYGHILSEKFCAEVGLQAASQIQKLSGQL